ncbi:MAG: hypothetical protein WA496_06210 [Candidatus Udaeobacter sp.]
MRTLAIPFLVLLIAHVAPAESKRRVIVDIHAPRAEIRETLLKHTPVGSSIGTVVGFISKRLEISGSFSAIRVGPAKAASSPSAAKTIRVYLGQYYKHLGTVFLTAPMVVHEDVSAQWLFDPNGRLIDIQVDKQARVY